MGGRYGGGGLAGHRAVSLGVIYSLLPNAIEKYVGGSAFSLPRMKSSTSRSDRVMLWVPIGVERESKVVSLEYERENRVFLGALRSVTEPASFVPGLKEKSGRSMSPEKYKSP
jgi:hypothetical protein